MVLRNLPEVYYLSLTRLLRSMAGLSRPLLLNSRFVTSYRQSYNPIPKNGLGYIPVRSPLLRESHVDFFSSGYLDVSLPLVSLHTLILLGV